MDFFYTPPPTIAVKKPITGGNSLALAMPRHNGNANKKTKKT